MDTEKHPLGAQKILILSGGNGMRRIVAIGNVLYVYLILGMLAMIFGSNTPTGMYLMKNLFFDDVYIMILAFIIFGAVWLAMNIVFLTLVVVGKLKYEASVMARTHMIVKLVQIPAYIGIFIMGLLCLLTFFTFAFSIALFLFDAFSIILTGLFAIACFSCMKNEGMITDGIQLVMSVFSFVFCADTIISVIAYINTKKHKAEALNN